MEYIREGEAPEFPADDAAALPLSEGQQGKGKLKGKGKGKGKKGQPDDQQHLAKAKTTEQLAKTVPGHI